MGSLRSQTAILLRNADGLASVGKPGSGHKLQSTYVRSMRVIEAQMMDRFPDTCEE